MREITAGELAELQQKGPVFLLDVRSAEEHEEDNIGGLLIPLENVLSQAAHLPGNQPVVVYCKRGIRSRIAIQKLEQKYPMLNLINLKGGMIAWNACL